MVENLKEAVKNILEDEKKVKEFGELKTLEEVYEKCKELGYKSDYEEFKKDYNQIVYGLSQEISSEELKSVTGGKMNKKLTKTMATALSALTLSTAVMPCTSAANLECQTSQNKTLKYIKENPGKSLLIALGATTAAVGGVVTIGLIGKRFFGKGEPPRVIGSRVVSIEPSQENTPSLKEEKDYCEGITYLTDLNCKSHAGIVVLKMLVNSLGTSENPYPTSSLEVYKCLFEVFYRAGKTETYNNYYFYDAVINLIHKMHSQGNVGMKLISDGLTELVQVVKNMSQSNPEYENVANVLDYYLNGIVKYIINKNNLTPEERKELFNDVFDLNKGILKSTTNGKYYSFENISKTIDSKFSKDNKDNKDTEDTEDTEYTIEKGYFPIIKSTNGEDNSINFSELQKINEGSFYNEDTFYIREGSLRTYIGKEACNVVVSDNYLRFKNSHNGEYLEFIFGLAFPNRGTSWYHFKDEHTDTVWHVSRKLGIILETSNVTLSRIYSIAGAIEEVKKGDKSKINRKANDGYGYLYSYLMTLK